MKEQSELSKTQEERRKQESNQLILEDVDIDCLEMYTLKVVVFWEALDIIKHRFGKRMDGYEVWLKHDSIQQNLVRIYYPRDRKEDLLINPIIPEDEHKTVLSEIEECLVDDKEIEAYVFESEEPDGMSIWKEKEDR